MGLWVADANQPVEEETSWGGERFQKDAKMLWTLATVLGPRHSRPHLLEFNRCFASTMDPSLATRADN